MNWYEQARPGKYSLHERVSLTKSFWPWTEDSDYIILTLNRRIWPHHSDPEQKSLTTLFWPWTEKSDHIILTLNKRDWPHTEPNRTEFDHIIMTLTLKQKGIWLHHTDLEIEEFDHINLTMNRKESDHTILTLKQKSIWPQHTDHEIEEFDYIIWPWTEKSLTTSYWHWNRKALDHIILTLKWKRLWPCHSDPEQMRVWPHYTHPEQMRVWMPHCRADAACCVHDLQGSGDLDQQLEERNWNKNKSTKHDTLPAIQTCN